MEILGESSAPRPATRDPPPMLPTLLLSAALLPAADPDSLVAPVPFGTPGDEVAVILERRSLQVLVRGPGRDLHAATADRQVQAVAVLAEDALIGIVYYHPETPSHSAPEVFGRAAADAERRHGPPTCRRSGFAVWPVEGGTLEVRLRGPRGDGAPGAEVRYLSLDYASEIERRDAARREARERRSSTGPALLGVPVPAAGEAEPVLGAGDAVEPEASTPEAAARALCEA